MKYSRVTYEVRCQIDAYLQAGFSISAIARKVGFHKSSISRELKRNFYGLSYHPGNATREARSRYRSCRKRYKVTPEIGALLLAKVQTGWSPQQVSGRFRLEKRLDVSHECLYQYIRKHKGAFRPYMKRMWRKYVGRTRRRQQPLNQNLLSISKRPTVVAKRSRTGDWERDVMFVAKRRPVLICVERRTRFLRMTIPKIMKTQHISELSAELITKDGKRAHTVTNDRGAEFNWPVPLSKVKTYYCDPYTPQQRGTIENTIGLLRKYLKNNTDLSDLTAEKIKEIEDLINFRPRKCLKYKTPYETYFNKIVALAN